MDKLLPCPFCGCEADCENNDRGAEWVECSNCGAESGASRIGSGKSIKAWNTRTHVSEPIKVNHVIDDSFDDLNNSRGDCD